jgi:bifunctional non-homologous end joining protein LigD
MGKVGTGFDDKLLRSVMAELARLKQVPRPFKERPLDDAQSVWVEPEIVCEVRYSSLTKDGRLREPVFLRLRPDMTTEDCQRRVQ